jgi:hypothetical protein
MSTAKVENHFLAVRRNPNPTSTYSVALLLMLDNHRLDLVPIGIDRHEPIFVRSWTLARDEEIGMELDLSAGQRERENDAAPKAWFDSDADPMKTEWAVTSNPLRSQVRRHPGETQGMCEVRVREPKLSGAGDGLPRLQEESTVLADVSIHGSTLWNQHL